VQTSLGTRIRRGPVAHEMAHLSVCESLATGDRVVGLGFVFLKRVPSYLQSRTDLIFNDGKGDITGGGHGLYFYDCG